MRLTKWLAASVAAGTIAAAAQQAIAQPSERLLRDEDVTVDALKEALTPEDRTRQIRVRPRPGAPGAAAPGAPAESPAAPDAAGMPPPPGSSPTARADVVGGRPAGEQPRASLLITFQTNSAQLTPRAREMLDVVGQALASDELSEFRFVIEGHADPRGNPGANLRLSQARAEAVQRYLQSQGIAPQRLRAVGKGDREQMNLQDPAAPENRRVTIVNVSG